MAELKEIRGTWEELSARAEEFKGLPLKLVILSDDEAAGKDVSADPKARVLKLLRDWQAQDNTPLIPSASGVKDATPIATLFQEWEEEDAKMSEEEAASDERFWEEFQEGINAERTKAGMRKVF